MARPRIDRRTLAAAALSCCVGGTLAIVVALVAGPGLGLRGYVSEVGAGGGWPAAAYRIGVLALAGGLLALAAAVPAALSRVALALLAAGGAAVVSALVTCSQGCPLPPWERATPADLVHGAASIAAVAVAVLAMLLLARSGATPGPIRRPAAAALVAAVPLSAAVGLAMLAVGRGTLVGLLERLLLAVILLWAVVTALRLTRHGVGRDDRSGEGQNSTVANVPTGRKPHRW